MEDGAPQQASDQQHKAFCQAESQRTIITVYCTCDTLSSFLLAV